MSLARKRVRMNAKTNHTEDDDNDMPNEIDFSKGVRGKFFHTDAQLHLPVYPDQKVRAHLSAIASKKGVQLPQLANALLKRVSSRHCLST